MKSFTAIFLFVLLVCVQTPVGQLCKLPSLIEHFIKHQEQDGTAMLGFLQDHYSNDHHDADQPEDEQLPFKNITFYTFGYAMLPALIQSNLSVPLPVDNTVYSIVPHVMQQHLASIFHPPRV